MPVRQRTLDACKTADEIADLLRAKGIKGEKRELGACPLANATGWLVSETKRFKRMGFKNSKRIPLTKAEQDFVKVFDDGKKFNDLVEIDYEL